MTTPISGEAVEIQIEEDSDSNETCCRICYEIDKPKNMIAPCLCSGDQKWIHRKCLNEYRAFHVSHPSFTQCNTCKFSHNIFFFFPFKLLVLI